MSGHQVRFTLLALVVLLTAAATTIAAEAQPCVPPSVAPSAWSSPIPTPTPSVDERLDALESQVADLGEEVSISRFREIADIVQIAVTVAAVIVGGVWSYWLFVKNRQRYPRASIVHTITHRHIGGGKLLLHVGVTISNVGDVLLSLVSLETRIQQVLPLAGKVREALASGRSPLSPGETEVAWPLVDSHELQLEKGTCEVEPGERQEIHHDFILDAGIEAIEVYTYLINEQKRHREIAWDLTTLYEFGEAKQQSSEEKQAR